MASDAWSPSDPTFDEEMLSTFIQLSTDAGFKLCLIERLVGYRQTDVVRALRKQWSGESYEVLDVCVSDFGTINLWSELQEGLNPPSQRQRLLCLRGFEETKGFYTTDRPEIFAQMNLQRELFVRDMPWIWLVLLQPSSGTPFRMVAPDLADFVSLWLKAPEDEGQGINPYLPPEALASLERPLFTVSMPVTPPEHTELAEIVEAINRGDYAVARDRLSRLELIAARENVDGEERLRAEVLEALKCSAQSSGEE